MPGARNTDIIKTLFLLSSRSIQYIVKVIIVSFPTIATVLFLFFMMFKWSSMLSSASRLNATCLYLVIRVASGAGMRDYLQVPPNCRMKIDHRTCTTDGRICPHIHN